MYPAIYGDNGPMSLPYFLTLLVNWRIGFECKGFHSSFIVLGNKFSFGNTKFQPQYCLYLLRILLSWCDGSPCCSSIHPPNYASLSRIWDVDATSNEFSPTLILPSVSPETIGIPRLFRCNRGPMRRKNLSQWNKNTYSALLVAIWTQLFVLPFDFESSSPLWSSSSSWNSWYNTWNWNGRNLANEEECSTHHVWNSF